MTYILPDAKRVLAVVLLPVTLVAGAGQAWAVENYDACTALVAADPERAVREAGAWARYGGGAPARHCLAMALSSSGASARAARELIDLANEEPELDDRARAQIVVQAGDILLELGDVLTAQRLAQQALRMQPGLPSGLRLSARCQIQTGAFDEALRDLDRALEVAGARADLLALRASVNRMTGRLVAARDDATYAVETDPAEPAAWLELGRIGIRMNDRDQARDALLKAIELDREGDIGSVARDALQRMETNALN